MSVPDSLHPNLLQNSQNDKSSNLNVGGSLLTNSIPSGSPNLNNFVAHNDIKLIASGFISPPTFPPPIVNAKKSKASGKSAVNSSAPSSQMRYIIGNSTNAAQSPSSPCRSPGLAMVTPASSFVGAPVALGAPPSTNAHRQTIMIRPSASNAPLSTMSPSPTTLMPINHGKAGASPIKEENAWPFIPPGNNMAKTGLHVNAQTITAPNTATTKVVPIRPGPSLVVQNQSNVSVIRPILSAAGLQQNHGNLPNNIGQPNSGIVRQPSPTQFVSYAPAVRTPLLFSMDPARFSNGVHPNVAGMPASSNAPSTVSLLPTSLTQPSTPVGSSAKVFPKSPIVVKEKSNANARKRDANAVKSRKPSAAKIKQEVSHAPFSSCVPTPKNPEALLNGVGLAPHVPASLPPKRSPDGDEVAATKKRIKKAHTEVDKSDVVVPPSISPGGVVSSSTPAPLPEVARPSSRTSPGRSVSSMGDNGVTDILCRDTLLAVSPPLDAMNGTNIGSTENGAVRKKTRLMYESGIKKLQQNNLEPVESQLPMGSVYSEPPSSIHVEQPANITSDIKEEKKPRRPRKPREKPPTPRVPKARKTRPVITTTKVVPLALTLKHTETEEQKKQRLTKLARKYFSLPDDQRQWLAATKSTSQLKLIRWLRLADGAYMHAESARNSEKMERLRDQKIHAVMDLEKLQAPLQPRLAHFLHSDDVAKKTSLIKKICNEEAPTKGEVKWLKGHYERLCDAERSVIHQGDAALLSPLDNYLPLCRAGEEATNSSSARRDGYNLPSTSRHHADEVPSTPSYKLVDFNSVQTAHQYIRKFPDSTKAMVELLPSGMPCAVVLLFQLPNSKAVHIKKKIKAPEGGFSSVDDALKAAASLLDRLVVKFLCLPPFPVHVRYPIVPGSLNDDMKDTPMASEISRWNFSRDMHGWETVQYINGHDLHVDIDDRGATNSDLCTDTEKSTVQSMTQNYPVGVAPTDELYRNLEQQIHTRTPINLTAMANDPVGQRTWLSWECRHLSQQYFDLEACQKLHEAWTLETVNRVRSLQLPDSSLARLARLMELTQDGIKKPKMCSATMSKTIKLGEQVRDVLESFKKERPMTRRKRAAAAARSQLLER
ncbi:uncharacterized protein LOC129581552 isoform X2 [Paramacrobiotus metropolitanus]|uniref:uncharacterized protein LOC129581552 isoform X2 n=1 Tax=Paramacrobiotus metropolitanus TaxID=2943436 RepID=UPI002445D437|nr:uncharacterized protein LOC129581552 isoform X2 [Paramacrobiotus metropolitanus]